MKKRSAASIAKDLEKKARIGRPPVRGQISDPDIQAAVLDRLEQGESMRSICRDPKMPCKKQLLDFVDEDKNFLAAYSRARERGWDARAELAVETAQRPGGDAALKRLAFDAERWFLSKMAKGRYGDKLDHTLANPDGSPILSMLNGMGRSALGVVKNPAKDADSDG